MFIDSMAQATWAPTDMDDCGDIFNKADNLDYVTADEEPVFDAADAARCGTDMIIQHGASDRQSGFTYLSPQSLEINRLRDVKGHVVDRSVQHGLKDESPGHGSALLQSLAWKSKVEPNASCSGDWSAFVFCH